MWNEFLFKNDNNIACIPNDIEMYEANEKLILAGLYPKPRTIYMIDINKIDEFINKEK